MKLAGAAGSLLTALSLAVVTIAPAAPMPLPQGAEAPPLVEQAVTVTRAPGIYDIDLLRIDFDVMRLTATVSSYVTSAAEPVTMDALAAELRATGWDVVSIDRKDFEYYYYIDETGEVRELCYLEGDIFVSDGDSRDLRVRVMLEQEL